MVFDHFHVVKLMNDAIDQIRREGYREEKDLNKRNVLKGTRWLLLCNGKDIFDANFRTRLDNALKLNEQLAQAYYLKESLKEIWMQVNKQEAETVMDEWINRLKNLRCPDWLSLQRHLLPTSLVS
ncbi:hypothetical protein EZS27_033806 [termite gut metagenome]|uniref:Transposase IS204/IS1001/IS1096/IS1165 DDE domain-containing protein n=1 Tax=termite gut metagenome TaxID=433724 RepID=A0A5J4Q3Y2_9ZZZZ